MGDIKGRSERERMKTAFSSLGDEPGGCKFKRRNIFPGKNFYEKAGH